MIPVAVTVAVTLDVVSEEFFVGVDVVAGLNSVCLILLLPFNILLLTICVLFLSLVCLTTCVLSVPLVCLTNCVLSGIHQNPSPYYNADL